MLNKLYGETELCHPRVATKLCLLYYAKLFISLSVAAQLRIRRAQQPIRFHHPPQQLMPPKRSALVYFALIYTNRATESPSLYLSSYTPNEFSRNRRNSKHSSRSANSDNNRIYKREHCCCYVPSARGTAQLQILINDTDMPVIAIRNYFNVFDVQQ